MLAIPTTIPTVVGNLPLILSVVVYSIVSFIVASKRTRRVQVFASAFGVVVIVAVLTVEAVIVNHDWVRLTLVVLWLSAWMVMFVLGQKTRQRGESVAMVVVGGVVTGALIGILFGIPRFSISSRWQSLLGFVILLLVVLAVPVILGLAGSEPGSSEEKRS